MCMHLISLTIYPYIPPKPQPQPYVKFYCRVSKSQSMAEVVDPINAFYFVILILQCYIGEHQVVYHRYEHHILLLSTYPLNLHLLMPIVSSRTTHSTSYFELLHNPHLLPTTTCDILTYFTYLSIANNTHSMRHNTSH